MTINAPGLNPLEVEGLPPVGDALNPATPFRRLMGSMATSYAGAFIVSAVPVSLLLTVHLSAIAGAEAASAFSIVTGVAALLGLIAQPLTGRFSDRSRARLGKRRSWILMGGLVSSLVLVGMIFTTEVWQVVVVWALVTIFVNVQLAATGALLAEQVPTKRRGSMSGILGSMAILGPVLGLGGGQHRHLDAVAAMGDRRLLRNPAGRHRGASPERPAADPTRGREAPERRWTWSSRSG